MAQISSGTVRQYAVYDNSMRKRRFIHRPALKTPKRSCISLRKLVDLPPELIGMVADYLLMDDLCALRVLRNQTLHQAIKRAFAITAFSRRICRTTQASVAHLHSVSCSPFADRVHTLEIHFRLECVWKGPGYPLHGTHCVNAANIGVDAHAQFSAIFSRLPNLKNLMISAPGYQPDSIYNAHNSTAAPYLYSLSFPDMNFALSEDEKKRHVHTIDVESYQTLLDSLVGIAQVTLPKSEQISTVDFPVSRWQPTLAGASDRPKDVNVIKQPSVSTIQCTTQCHDYQRNSLSQNKTDMPKEMIRRPFLQIMTTLDLQLNVFTRTTGAILEKVGGLIRSNPNLKVLKLCAGPRMCSTYRIPNDHWAPLLKALGSGPPFRLDTLELGGLVTSTTAPTLARVVETHSPTLRRLVLEHTSFGYPNTLRAFFNTLVKSEVRYYAWRDFLVDQTSYLIDSQLKFWIVGDEVLTPRYDLITENSFETASLYNTCNLYPTTSSDKDWVMITWDVADKHELFVWDDEDSLMGKGGIKATFRNVGVAIDCGIISAT